MHDILVGHIRIREDHLFHAVFFDQLWEVAFGVDGDALRVERSGQLGGIQATFDVRDLGGCESHDLVFLVPAEERIEVMEVAACGAHDEGFDWHRFLLIGQATAGTVSGRPGIVDLSRAVFTRVALLAGDRKRSQLRKVGSSIECFSSINNAYSQAEYA